MNLHIYNEYETIPPWLRVQWRRLRLLKYRTVPEFQHKWTAQGNPTVVVMLLGDDSKVLLAWAMGVCVPSKEAPEIVPPKWHLMLYVRKNQRRKGYGNKVMEALKGHVYRLYSPAHVEVYPHDPTARAFLKQAGFDVD